MALHLLDLRFLGYDHAIAAFLIETSAGPALIECGPHATLPELEKEIARCGYALSEIQHVLLSHIHFDHAGAAWAFAESGARIYVHPAGANHLVAPEKLYQSAKRIYGAEMERLWGDMRPIAREQVQEMGHGASLTLGDQTFIAWHTPGHARHHLAWQSDHTIFTGDVAGVSIQKGPPVAPCPPPDIDIASWKDSLRLLRGLQPHRLFLTHFGEVTQPEAHLDQLEEMLDSWAAWMYPRWQNGDGPEEIIPDFQAFTQKQLLDLGVSPADLPRYEAANPSFMSVAGLLRYWTLKSEGKLA